MITLLLINLAIAIVAFYFNYKATDSPYYVKEALVDALLSLVPIINIIYILATLINWTRTTGWVEKILNKKLK